MLNSSHIGMILRLGKLRGSINGIRYIYIFICNIVINIYIYIYIWWWWLLLLFFLLLCMYIYIPRYLLYYTNILFVYISNQLKAKTGRSSKIGHSDSQVTGNPMPYDINAFVTWRFPGFDQRWIIFQSNCSLKLMLSFWGNVTPLNGLPDMVEEFELLSRKTGKWGWIKTYAIFWRDEHPFTNKRPYGANYQAG